MDKVTAFRKIDELKIGPHTSNKFRHVKLGNKHFDRKKKIWNKGWKQINDE